MSDLSTFLALNAGAKEHKKCVVSEGILENGQPLVWEIRAINATEDEQLRQSAARQAAASKHGQSEAGIYMCKLAASCTVYPNLNSVELQQKYNVSSSVELLKAMLSAGEYVKYVGLVREMNDFNVPIRELVDQAKK